MYFNETKETQIDVENFLKVDSTEARQVDKLKQMFFRLEDLLYFYEKVEKSPIKNVETDRLLIKEFITFTKELYELPAWLQDYFNFEFIEGSKVEKFFKDKLKQNKKEEK
ncbi:MAG: hypothetical protein V2B14_04425 [bacterium]